MFKRLASFIWQLIWTWGARLILLLGVISAIQLIVAPDIFKFLPPNWRIPTIFVALIIAAFEVFNRQQEKIDEFESRPHPELDVYFPGGSYQLEIPRKRKRPAEGFTMKVDLPPGAKKALSKLQQKVGFAAQFRSSSLVVGPPGDEIDLRVANAGNGSATHLSIELDIDPELGLQEPPAWEWTSGYSARIEDSHVVFPEIERLGHDGERKLPSIYVKPKEDGEYKIQWRLRAEELHETLEGELTVRVRTEYIDGDQVE